jgi:hypothetical protein
LQEFRPGNILAPLAYCCFYLERVVKFFTRFFFASLALAALLTPCAHAEQVVCHYTYGGETKEFVALPVASPYSVKGIDIGSFFNFRVVFQNRPADIASIKVYTYVDRDNVPVIIHQATYPYPPTNSRTAPYGFSGLHSVYEPLRDGELQYWCEWSKSAKRIKQ